METSTAVHTLAGLWSDWSHDRVQRLKVSTDYAVLGFAPGDRNF